MSSSSWVMDSTARIEKIPMVDQKPSMPDCRTASLSDVRPETTAWKLVIRSLLW